MPYKDPAKKRQWYEEQKNKPMYKERKKAATKKWYQAHKAENYKRVLAWNKEHKSRLRELGQISRTKLKVEVLLHYANEYFSSSIPCCEKCKFSDIRALTLDLVKGGHNRSGLPGGTSLYRLLKKQGYPKGWQVLCMNCQWIKRWTNNELH